MKPRRSGHHAYVAVVPRSFAKSAAILFSKPSSLSLEYGRLFGSAQTRNAALAAWPGVCWARVAEASERANVRTTATTMILFMRFTLLPETASYEATEERAALAATAPAPRVVYS